MYCIYDFIALSFSALISSTGAGASSPPPPEPAPPKPAYEVGLLEALKAPAAQEGALGALLAPSDAFAFTAAFTDNIDDFHDDRTCCKGADPVREVAQVGGAFGRFEPLGRIAFPRSTTTLRRSER